MKALTVSPEFTGASAVYPWSKSLESRFSHVDRYGEPFTMWRRSGNRIRLPRAACPMGEDRRVDGPNIHLTSTFKARNLEQDRCVRDVIAFLQAGHSGVLQATTGCGKTVIALEAAKRVGKKTLVIVTKDDLMQQWKKRIAQFLPGTRVGKIRQNTYDVKDKDIVIGMIHSLAKPDRYPASMRDEFGLVIWDECHHVPADTFQNTAFIFSAKLRLGLSARPQRKDGKDIVIWSHIGPVRVAWEAPMVKPTVALYDSPWVCPRVTNRRTGQVQRMPHKAGKCGHVLNMLARHRGRNELLSHLAVYSYNKGRHVVLFSDRVAHLEQLRAMAQRAGVPLDDTVLYINRMTKREKETAPSKRLILATYGMMAEATDIPWLDVCILGTPRSDILQPVGRIRREYEGKPHPVVMDIVDRDSPVFANYFKNRMRDYRKIASDVLNYGE